MPCKLFFESLYAEMEAHTVTAKFWGFFFFLLFWGPVSPHPNRKDQGSSVKKHAAHSEKEVRFQQH